MFQNYIRIAFRNFIKNRLTSVINIFGLAFGIALSILMFMYVYSELSYDNFHKNKHLIYRINLGDEGVENIHGISAITTAAIGPSMLEDFPEVENVVRFSDHKSGFITSQGKNFELNNLMYADSSVFQVFSFELLYGNPNTALTQPYSVVLTKNSAEKIFGNYNVIGKIISFNNEFDLLITGIIEDPHENSQLKFNALISFTSLYTMPDKFLGWNGGHDYYTYIKINENTLVEELKNKLPAFTDRHINEKVGTEWKLFLEPLENIHLYSNATADLPTKGDLNKIYSFFILSIFVLLIACINFINLTTVQSLKRAREVGLRKVSGASKKQLITQFLGESLLLSVISLIFALILVEIFEPVFNNLMGTKLHLFVQPDIVVLITLLFITLFTGLAAGSIPAFYISKFQPIIVIKGLSTKQGKPILRNALVILQFFISVLIIISTIVIYLQLNFLNNKELGFNKENVIIVELTSESAMKKIEIMKNEFITIPGVAKVGASTNYPGSGLTKNGYLPEGNENWIMCHALDVDCDYLQLMDIEIVSGRNFKAGSVEDKNAYILNETLAKRLGWENPFDKTIFRGKKHKIIGVVKDFHFSSLHNKIEPLIISNQPWDYFYVLSVKVNPENTQNSLTSLKNKWKELMPNEPFNYRFLNQAIAGNYVNESKTGLALIYLSLISIIIACLGLFGQAAYSAEIRKKEIGIRKVVGASTKIILVFLSANYAKVVLAANVIAWPIAFYFTNKWLNEFAFHISISLWIFVIVLILSLLITSATVLTTALKVANSNPADVLKYE